MAANEKLLELIRIVDRLRLPLEPTLIARRYCVLLAYTSVLFLGGSIVCAMALLSFGLASLVFLALEWIVSPAVSILLGLQARWSPSWALTIGLPISVHIAVITPIADAGPKYLHIPVPWLSAPAQTHSKILEQLATQVCLTTALFAISMLIGIAIRYSGNSAEQLEQDQ